MAERRTESGSNNHKRPIDPTQVIPGTYHVTETRGSFQLYGKNRHYIQVNFDPTTMQVGSLWVSPGMFVRSERRVSGEYEPKDMKLGIVLDKESQEPIEVSFAYNPTDISVRYSGYVYLDLVPFAEAPTQ